MKYLIIILLFISCNGNDHPPVVVTKPPTPTPAPTPWPADSIYKDTSELRPVYSGTNGILSFKSSENTITLLGDGSDNLPTLQNSIDKVPQRSTIYLPDGTFYFDGTINLINKSIYLIGTGNTNFYFKEGVTGILVSGNNGYMPGKIEGINLFQNGPNPLYDTTKIGNGIEIHALYDLENINIKNFGGAGVYTSGGVESNTNSSFNKYESVFVREVGGNGFYFQGGDANQTSVYRCGIWDVRGWGFYDHSFLGNQFLHCMAHASKLGNYRADDANNRATFTGCYGEGGSPADYYGGASRVYGGIHGADGDNWKTGNWGKVDAD